MKLLSALAVGLLLAGPVSAQTDTTRTLYTSMLLDYIDGDFKGFFFNDYIMTLMKDKITPELEGDLAALRGKVSEDSRHDTGPNYIYARRHYLEGAKLGNGEAQYRLAKLLALGKGGPQDVVTAYMWSNISVLNETPWDEVISFRENLANIMTPRELLNAQRRARVCMASNYQDCD